MAAEASPGLERQAEMAPQASTRLAAHQTLWTPPPAGSPDPARLGWEPAVSAAVATEPATVPDGIAVGPDDVTVVLDAHGLVASISANCSTVLGFDRSELLGASVRDLVHPDDLTALTPARRAFGNGLTDYLSSRQRVLHKELGYRLVETTVRSAASRVGGRPAGAIVVIRVPAHEMHEAVGPTVSLAPAAIGTAYAWVAEGSRQAFLASADPMFASLLRTTPAALAGCPIESITDPHDPDLGLARFLALLDGSGSSYQVERALPGDEAAVELTVSLLSLLDQSGHMAVVQARDASRRRELEESVQSSLAELQRSNRELEAFASVAAHDLAAPLRVVVGYAEMLAKPDEQVSPRIAELLAKVATTSRRMQAQVDGLMTLARTEGEELDASSYDLAGLIDEAIDSLQNDVARTGADVQVGPMPVVTCNATSVVQVLQNLISNAIKYGGANPQVSITSTRELTAWRISVLDRGLGLPDCHEENLFELFERGGVRQVPGAGIGLALCRRIVERHGGRIWCQQRSGGGAEFHFTLPDRDCMPGSEFLPRGRP